MAKVLVVEDEPSIVTVARYHLESAGFDSLFAGDVSEAWHMLVVESPAAAVIDTTLPDEDGWGLIERLRADGRFDTLPIVVLAGLLQPEVVERAAALGCDYLSKPFAASALLSKLRVLLPPDATSGEVLDPLRGGGRTELVAVGVVLLLDNYQVEGTVHLPPELARFSDAWESLMSDQRSFVPVTSASVYPAGGGHTLATPTFIEVRKHDVRAVFPKDVQQAGVSL
jgi:CheY-like chemotaxis protein